MENFKIGDLVKIKNPGLNYQKELRYIITFVSETVVHCYEINNPNNIYLNIKKSALEKVLT